MPTAVLVVNYASAELIERNVVPLARTRPELIVVVADNWTSSLERAAIDRLSAAEGWTLVVNGENLGFGAAMNGAAEVAIAAGADSLLLLNPDAVIDSSALDRLTAALTDRSIVAPTITRTDGTPWFRGSDLGLRDGRVWGRPRRPADTLVMEWLTGACLLIPVGLWREMGGFEDVYFLYWEDVDLSWKAHRAGAEVTLVADAVAMHDAGGTQGAGASGSEPKSAVYYYFNVRNRLLFAALRLDPAVAWEVLRIGGRRHLLRSSRPWRAAVLGVLDGWSMGRSLARGVRPEPPRTEQALRRAAGV